jgi:hypothetical protein
MYAQDPALTQLDTDFLSLLGVATTSTIETHISRTAFVFSPFVDWFLLLPTFLAGADPALYVGNEILDDYSVYAHGKEKKEKLEECNVLGKAFLEAREGTKLASLETHAHALEGMIVYWRKEREIEAEGVKENQKEDQQETKVENKQESEENKPKSEKEKEDGSGVKEKPTKNDSKVD